MAKKDTTKENEVERPGPDTKPGAQAAEAHQDNPGDRSAVTTDRPTGAVAGDLSAVDGDTEASKARQGTGESAVATHAEHDFSGGRDVQVAEGSAGSNTQTASGSGPSSQAKPSSGGDGQQGDAGAGDVTLEGPEDQIMALGGQDAIAEKLGMKVGGWRVDSATGRARLALVRG